MISTAQRWAFMALLALLAPGAALGTDVPFLTGRVVDNAEILKPATRDTLTAALKAHEQVTGNHVTHGDPVESAGQVGFQFAVREIDERAPDQAGPG